MRDRRHRVLFRRSRDGLESLAQHDEGQADQGMHELVNNVRPMAVIAGEIVAMTKPELIEIARSFDGMQGALTGLADATASAKALVDIISAADARALRRNLDCR
jgi:hypothetical protein